MLLDLLFPKHCVVCKSFGSYLCPNCFAGLSLETSVICLVCGKASIDGLTHPVCRKKYSIDGVFCAVRYNKIAKKLVYVFKYQPYLSDVQDVLIDLVYEALIQKQLFTNNLTAESVFIPIPLSNKKLKQRGYNQSLLLAKGLGKKFNLPITDIISRSKETIPQFGLQKDQRKENLKHAFEIKKTQVLLKHKTTFLVDDVLTTGTTLAEAANVLKRNGFERVWGITFARD